jgi:hypothetical protein
MEGLVFVLRGERYPLSSGERAALYSFTNADRGESLLRLRGKMIEAGDVGAEIEIRDDGERYALLESLVAAAPDERYFTEGLQRLLEAARVPITRPRQ